LKTLVLGLGNPILCDDSVGWQVVDCLKARLNGQDVALKQSSASGISLLEEIIGYEHLIIIDAVQTQGGQPGKISRLEPADFDTTPRTASTHGLSFTRALEIGKKLGLSLPGQVIIFAIEARDVSTFSERCTPEVEKAIPLCVDMVAKELRGN
jgi:hydrogenase maturation protease